MDKNIIRADSSDPYFALLKLDAAGKPVEICRSKHISSDLNPSWEPVELRAEILGDARELTLHVAP